MALPKVTLATPARSRASHIPGYYEGFVEKQDSETKDYKKFWTVLRGNHLCFQVTSREPTYLERVDLDEFISMEDDNKDKSQPGAKLTLRLKRRKLKLRMDSVEAREEWKGFIHTVVKLEIPKLSLLPGQIQRLLAMRDEEIDRRAKLTISSPPRKQEQESSQDFYDDVENTLPSCYHKVSRVEAEMVLERNSELGNILLRPGSDNKNFSITVRQVVNGVVSVRHYRVRCSDNGYIIDVDQGILQSSLQGVIDHFVKYTNGILKPLDNSQDYEEHLTILKRDNESGEVINEELPAANTGPSPPSKPGKKALRPSKPSPAPPDRPDDYPERSIPPIPPKVSKDIFGLSTDASQELHEKLMKRRKYIEASESKAKLNP
ncbi:signal-transducing adaptor protein 2 [Callorhinchus milii]|uniref:Signal transducing adaptor family member 2 n=1 Tax=Callorhinchus milii TaxID=7868 RepID=K4FUD6_CALMI|nr:signal-transducing adaptor protein 2 [Callorhinchus milii]AFK11079.1 signal transducing adaptor family member 2 [Callorhinchus milii]